MQKNPPLKYVKIVSICQNQQENGDSCRIFIIVSDKDTDHQRSNATTRTRGERAKVDNIPIIERKYYTMKTNTNTTSEARTLYNYREAIKAATTAALKEAKPTSTSTPATINPIKAAHIARSIKTLDKLSRRTDEPSHRHYTRIVEALHKVAPEALHTFTATTTSTATERTRKAHAAPINHRAEEAAAARGHFANEEYRHPTHANNAKAFGASARGVLDENNLFKTEREDMTQIAALAMWESYMEGLVFTATIPAELERDYWEDHCTPYQEALKALGRTEYHRANSYIKEGTPLEHVKDNRRVSSQEKAITEREALKDWTHRVIELIDERERTHNITAKQAADLKHIMNRHPEKVNNAPRAKTHLINLLLKAGLLKRAKDGKLEVVSE